MKPQDCIFYNLAKASQAGNKVWKEALAGFKVTAVQGMVLNFLHDGDHITSKDLGKKTLLDSATLTGILDRLEAAELMTRTQNPDDRRAVIISLTEKGKQLVDEMYREIDTINKVFLKCLNKEEEKTLRALLKKIRTHSDTAFAEVRSLHLG
jgi:DNA-binding MarR family transcriptional regulator